LTGSAKAKGDRGEREVVDLLRDLLRGLIEVARIRRELGAGRKEDFGDIANVPYTALQVTWRQDLTGAIYEKIEGVERQRKAKRVPFAATFARKNGRPWVVVMTPQQWRVMWKYAKIGWEATASTRAQKRTKMASHGPRSTGVRPRKSSA
jgi:hypothetical protein